MSATRVLFFVVAPAGRAPTALTHRMPANQRLGDLLQITLALPASQGAPGAWGEAAEYLLHDLYARPVEPGILLRHVPFPGCVIAVSDQGAVEVGGERLSGAAAASAVARSISGQLLAQRPDEEDPIARRYARYLLGGGWTFEPTPVTAHDVALSFGSRDARVAQQLGAALTAKGLRVCTRGAGAAAKAARLPVEDARALVVVVSEAARDDPWLAFDVGAAWSLGRPVFPVLVGRWRGEPPDILAPYQRLSWGRQRGRLVRELVELLDLEPWSMPTGAGSTRP